MDIASLGIQTPNVADLFSNGQATNILNEISNTAAESAKGLISGVKDSVVGSVTGAIDDVKNNAVSNAMKIADTVMNIPEVAVQLAVGVKDDALQYGQDKLDYIKDWGLDTVKGLPGRILDETSKKTAQKIQDAVPGLAMSIMGCMDLEAVTRMAKSLEELKNRLLGMVQQVIGDTLQKITDRINDAVNQIGNIANYIMMGEDWVSAQITALENKYIKEPIDEVVDYSISFVDQVIYNGIDVVSETCATVAADAAIRLLIKPLKLAYDMAQALIQEVLTKVKTLVVTTLMSLLALVGIGI